MLLKKFVILSRPFQALLHLSIILCILLSCTVPAYAKPESPGTTAPAVGWVEVRCDPVPADFSDTATAVISNTETGEMYTVTCHKINQYIGRLQLPAGKYQVEKTSTEDNFAYEALTSTISFDITADMPAAQLITLEIIKHDAVFTVPEAPTEPEALPDLPTATAPSQSPDEPATNPTVPDNAVLDLLHQESQPNEAEPQADAVPETPSADSPLLSSLVRGLMIILGSGLFVVFVFGTVYVIRLRGDD